MSFQAITDYPVIELIKNRWSPGVFAENLVEAETLLSIFEAGRWAPSGFNSQPWRFIIAAKNKPALYDRFLGFLNVSNARWAVTAPVLGVLTSKKTYEKNNKPNDMHLYEAGLAMGNLLNQATAMGVCVHQIGGFDKEKTRAGLAIPDDYELVVMFAMGYYTLNGEKVNVRSRQRKSLSEIVFDGEWGKPLV